MTDKHSRHTLPSVDAFKACPDDKRREAYMCGFRALHEERVTRPDIRRQLLERYIKIAGWDEESVRTMQAAVQTPISGA